MHISHFLPLSLLIPAVAGHGIPLPRFSGGGAGVPSFALPRAQVEQHDHRQRARATNGQCGAGFGSCPAGQCCSFSGYCGTGTLYCAAPDCQINYSPACDGNQKPPGFDTTNVPRPKIGNVPYGGLGVVDCVVNGEIAITFDDGPYNFTGHLLDILQAANVKATFFMTGNNLGKGMINDPATPWPSLIKRMVANGHQVASHSWSHQNQTQLTTAQLQQQIIWNEIAFNDILGFFPTYWRPPYSICNTACANLLGKFGYHVTYLDLDTEGYLYPNDMTIPKSLWDQAMAVPAWNNDWLQDEHEIIQQVVYTLVPYMLSTIASHGYVPVTLGQCLNDPPANWYRAGTGAVPAYPFTSPTPTATSPGASTPTTSAATTPTGGATVSTSGMCSNGVTCKGSSFGNCCSTSGWCGSTAAYCGNGCQAAWGQCTGSGLQVSTNAACGNGVTCQGSAFGNCCSQNGWCGSTAPYCGTGCQAGFGTCQ